MIITNLYACNDEIPERIDNPENKEENSNQENDNDDTDRQITIKISSNTFIATLQNNKTARAFTNMLPMTVTMNELNCNEKYYELSQSLPTASSTPGTIRRGDIMLYGTKTLVLFYNTFSSSHSYTKIGTIDNPVGLETALGTGNITITFEQVNNQGEENLPDRKKDLT